MIVRSLQDLKGTKGDVSTDKWSSQRFLHREDGMGFTLTETTVPAGTGPVLHYKNHFEAVYTLEGEGTLENLETGETFELRPGVMYALNKHDKHRIHARTPMRYVCVFNPALMGGEKHDAEGSYPAPPAD